MITHKVLSGTKPLASQINSIRWVRRDKWNRESTSTDTVTRFIKSTRRVEWVVRQVRLQTLACSYQSVLCLSARFPVIECVCVCVHLSGSDHMTFLYVSLPLCEALHAVTRTRYKAGGKYFELSLCEICLCIYQSISQAQELRYSTVNTPSKTRTRRPASTRRLAVASPATPAPMTTTSNFPEERSKRGRRRGAENGTTHEFS